MIGEATIAPTQEKMLRTKLLSATPADDFLGMNSVNMVVAMPKISIDPIPKKKLATICVLCQIQIPRGKGAGEKAQHTGTNQ